MSKNEVSKKYLQITLPEIERVTCIKPNIWEATTPETLPEEPLKFFPTKPTFGTKCSKLLSPTEKSVWYSHFNLWAHIKNTTTPSWIFEHDVDLSKINILVPYNYDIVNLRGMGCLEAYFITPKGAGILYNLAIESPIYYQADGFLYSSIKSKPSIQQIYHTPNLPIKQLGMFGSTIDHQPSFATCQDLG